MPTRHCLFYLFSLHKSLTCTHLKDRNEPQILPFGEVTVLWLPPERKDPHSNSLFSCLYVRSDNGIIILLHCRSSHAEQAFKPQLNWFWLYWFYKTSGTVNGWVMVLKHVFEFSHKRYDLIQPVLDYRLTTVTSSKGKNAAESDAMRPRRLDDKKQYNFYLAFSLSLEHVPLEPCAII